MPVCRLRSSNFNTSVLLKKEKASAFDTPLDYLLIGIFFSCRKFMIADAIFSSLPNSITTKSQF